MSGPTIPVKMTPRAIQFGLPVIVALIVVLIFGEAVGWKNLYTELKAWQAGIGAMIGLFGLAGAALLNAHLNRQRDDRLRNEDGQALATALAAELEYLKMEINLYVNAAVEAIEIGKTTMRLFHGVRLFEQPVFKANTDKFGLLGIELAQDIVETYGNFTEFNHIIYRWKTGWPESDLIDNEMVEALKHRAEMATNNADALVPKLRDFSETQ